MHEEIIVAGFGGQGVLFTGRLLCIAAMCEGKHVSHFPSYGAEMRGGTANCSVIVSDEEIAVPVVYRPTISLILNKPSLFKFEPCIREEGLLLWNTSLINVEPTRSDISLVPVSASKIAEEIGNYRVANMVMLGALLKAKSDMCSLGTAIQELDQIISVRHGHLREMNIKALESGFQLPV